MNAKVRLFCFRLQIHFLGKFVKKKIKIIRLSSNFGAKSNLNIQNLMVSFPFSVFDGKHSIWTNLVQKMKIDILS